MTLQPVTPPTPGLPEAATLSLHTRNAPHIMRSAVHALTPLAALLGLWPGLIDRVAVWIGISYPPAALLLGAVVMLFVKSLYVDIANTRLERQLRRLNQRIALLDARDSQPDQETSEP